MLLLLCASTAFAQQSVGNQLPSISAQNLTARYGNGILGQTVIVTNVSAPCSQGATPTFTGATTNTCRAASTGSGWKEIITAPGASNTFSVANACNTSARATGGCTFNSVVYGAGGTPIPTFTSPTVVTCTNTSSDPGLIQTAMGSGGTSGSHKQILLQGTQCDMTSTVNVPSFTDVQCANSSTVIFNPYPVSNPSTTCPNSPSFKLSSTTTNSFYNCTYNGVNTIPPYYPDRAGSCSATNFDINGESASNLTIEDNLFLNCTSQGCNENYGGSSATPGGSNYIEAYNTYDNCALYGPQAVNITNAVYSHNYLIDCRDGFELDNGTSQLGTYQNNYSYVRRRTSYGYNYSNCGGPSTLDAFCTLHRPGTSCSMTGIIVDAAGAAPTGTCASTCASGSCSNSGLATNNGVGGTQTFSQNYCYDGTCSCDSLGGGCTVGTPPNPAPSGP